MSRSRTAAAAALLALGLSGVAPLSATAAPAAVPGAAHATAPAAAPALALAVARARAGDTKARLDGKGRTAPVEVTGWYVDDATGQVVVSVSGPETRASDVFVEGVDPASVRVEPGAAPVRPLANLVDGKAMYGPGVRCSVGFSVRSATKVGVLTAGHCTAEGGPWRGASRGVIGPVALTRFPVDDFGLVTDTDPKAWKPTARVSGGPDVAGSQEAPVGAKVCRSGSSTGYKCGAVLTKNVTVNYGNGEIVYGLTRTSACAEAGDSGGAFLTPDTRQAQGMLSGGTGDCRRNPGVTFFQPVGEALAATGTTLVTTR